MWNHFFCGVGCSGWIKLQQHFFWGFSMGLLGFALMQIILSFCFRKGYLSQWKILTQSQVDHYIFLFSFLFGLCFSVTGHMLIDY